MDLSVVPYGQISPEAECGKAEENGGLESPPPRPALPQQQQQQGLKGKVRYRECLKNHAASIGGHANDGCGEFMPDGEEGSIEGLRCAACGCHRNFHRKVVAASRDDDLDFRRCCSLIEAAAPESAGRKRFRTKFSAEQKERMLEFAEKIGWRIQKGEEAAIQNFCRETGVSRRVFKVWMHNHKNSSANASSLTQ